MSQLEFADIRRGQPRPPGSGQVLGGLWVYSTPAQSAGQVAYTIGKTTEHVYHLIDEGAFPNVRDFATTKAARASYVIPRSDVLDYLEFSKTAAVNR